MMDSGTDTTEGPVSKEIFSVVSIGCIMGLLVCEVTLE
jgi:hypothetical protein